MKQLISEIKDIYNENNIRVSSVEEFVEQVEFLHVCLKSVNENTDEKVLNILKEQDYNVYQDSIRGLQVIRVVGYYFVLDTEKKVQKIKLEDSVDLFEDVSLEEFSDEISINEFIPFNGQQVVKNEVLSGTDGVENNYFYDEKQRIGIWI